MLDGAEVLLLCSNNYLGLADHPRVRQAAADAAERYGAGAGASRLISGDMELHGTLERRLAAFKGTEAALLFGSGYLANMGVVAALAGEGGVVFSDELNHASIIDGCRLARAETFVYRHRDTEHLAWGLEQAQGRSSLIVTDGVFSMDGDVAPLPALAELAGRHGARLMVDEAHGTGAIGPGGRGTVAAAGPRGRGRRRRGHARQGARRLRRLRLHLRAAPRVPHQPRAAVHLLDRSPAPFGRRSARRARAARVAARGRRAAAPERGGDARGARLVRPGRRRLADADHPRHGRRRAPRRRALRARTRRRRLRPGDPAADRSRGHVAPAPDRDGEPPRRRASERRPRDRQGRAGARRRPRRAHLRQAA